MSVINDNGEQDDPMVDISTVRWVKLNQQTSLGGTTLQGYNVDTKPTGMSWKEQVEYMKNICDLACGGATPSSTWSVWSMILIIAIVKSIF